MSKLAEGDALPAFELPTDGGGSVSSASLAGKPYVLYLYPRDDTPGCTIEAKDFTRRRPDFDAIDVPVIGLSRDDVASHDRFKQKYALELTLAADTEGGLVEALGAWVEKNQYGRKSMGIERSTFLVDKDGRIARAWRKVQVADHVDEVLEAARTLTGS